jgi:4-aminobutyrate aminotransferase-like enzyme
MAKQPLMVNSYDPANSKPQSASIESLLRRRTKVLGPAYRLFYENPVHVVRAEGVHLYDESGTAFLDVYNNVPVVGHCHPHVVEAQARQAAVLNTHTRYLYDVVLTYAEKLTSTFPAPLANVMFTCTGSESSDLALRIARICTKGTGIVVTANAYHGLTAAVAEASPSLGDGVPLGAHVRVVPAPDSYRIGTANVAGRFSADVQAAIADMRRHGIKPAALIFDTIFSSDGILSHPPGFIEGAVTAMRAAGGIYIADEVQPGFGRTGSGMWGFSRHGVIPDLVVLGKPMGNGLPIGGVVARPEILEEFAGSARYFNTFGGNPVCSAAGLAVLQVLENEHLIDNARNVGAYIQDGLVSLQREYTVIGDVRGAGLFIGVDLVSDAKSRTPNPAAGLSLVNRLRDKNVLISASGPLGHVLKIRPPLPFSRANADEFLGKLGEALHELSQET